MKMLTVAGVIVLAGALGLTVYAQGRCRGGGARNRAETRTEKRDGNQEQSQEQSRERVQDRARACPAGNAAQQDRPQGGVGSCGRTCATCDRDCPGCDKDCARCLKACPGCDMDCGNCEQNCERAMQREHARDGQGVGCPKMPAVAPAGGAPSEAGRGAASDKTPAGACPRGSGPCGSCPGCETR